jgi:hypothetical protein
MNDFAVNTCLERASEYLQTWPREGRAAALVHAALELRWALELYLLARVEEISGARPKVEGSDPLELLDEALLLHDEAMSPQGWSVGVMEQTKENPALSSASVTGFAVLTVRKARSFYGQLDELAHATAAYLPRAETAAFWDKQCQQLWQIHAELAGICLGTGGATRVKGGGPATGTEQSAVL